MSLGMIRTEEENEACTELLYELDRRSSKLTPAEKELADLLTLLIEDFEDRHYQLPQAKPLEVLQFLMDQHGLLQNDLADVFGTPSIVSEVLSGTRDLNKDHIKRLSRRFHVSPELFFQWVVKESLFCHPKPAVPGGFCLLRPACFVGARPGLSTNYSRPSSFSFACTVGVVPDQINKSLCTFD